MGRVKIRIQKIKTATARQVTYSKRKAGLMKKAKEIATLCDIDLMVLALSPRGKPTICVGEKSDLASVIERLSNLTVDQRLLRKADTLNLLKKIYKNDEDHEVDMESFSNHKKKQIENQLQQLQEQIIEKNNKLSTWINPDGVDDLAQIKAMEEMLVGSLNRLHRRKGQLIEGRLRRPWSTSQAHRVPWIPLERFRENPNLEFSQRNLGLFANNIGQAENIGGEVGLGSQSPFQQERMINLIQQSDLAKLNQDASPF